MQGSGEKIRARREELGWSQTKLATLAGISQSFLWRLERGTGSGSWETYTRIAGALGKSVEALFPSASNVEDANIGWRRVPVLDYVQAGQWKNVVPQIDDESMREYILTDLEHPPSTFALRIRGDSMAPEYREGDVIVVDPTRQPKPGDYVVARDENGEATFKLYKEVGLNSHGQMVFELVPMNDLYPRWRSDIQRIAIVGTAVEHRRYLRR